MYRAGGRSIVWQPLVRLAASRASIRMARAPLLPLCKLAKTNGLAVQTNTRTALISGNASSSIPSIPSAIPQLPVTATQSSTSPPQSSTSPQLRWKEIPEFSASLYQDLSKAKLSAFIVLSTMCGYAMAPGATILSGLLWTTLGTTLCVSSANSINQWIEAPYDAQMSRTRNRPLVRHALSPLHAFSFGMATGLSGVTILYSMVNPLTALLGGLNIILYTCVYTPLKRTSISNTWAGAIVGGIPPMMGWAACTGTLDPGAWVLAAVLYAWQFPHFNALSWNLRADYSKAGYRMTSVINPDLNARVALRYSLLLFPLAYLAPAIGMTTWWFAIDSTLVNAMMAVAALRFWKHSSDKTARELFFGSLVHLPVFLALLLLHKQSSEAKESSDNAIKESQSPNSTKAIA
ncbi:hypothetical protein SmJEL517_g04781 [Synchytrium microbalum]|uniref:Protoheme IX farnesyltransferase, mitochondrial n=1 Tax=Synchytrium microbalum TaxID=1806994 RepID=A0A507BYY0_9FUNG|nr:uncharacterized protein SmJEL517_g04781 [Synchytrium microbalum]TPX32069.1 hypothetical protein SmJEL517_g04781 [Synchytrium microbalum]